MSVVSGTVENEAVATVEISDLDRSVSTRWKSSARLYWTPEVIVYFEACVPSACPQERRFTALNARVLLAFSIATPRTEG
jgi:hypothetical protein